MRNRSRWARSTPGASESFVVGCDCGERPTLTAASTITCDGCGTDHEAVIREGLDGEWLGDEAAHP